MTTRFVLASASPARLATLRSGGLSPDVVVSGVDEDAVARAAGEVGVASLAGRLAVAKAHEVTDRLIEEEDARDLVVLGCDSLLELDGRALGKPGSPEQVVQRWSELAGREAVLHTGHCLVRVTEGALDASAEAVPSTTVRFGRPTREEVAAYAASGEPAEVAGGFTIDGLGGWFVEGVDGDHHTVVGVSLPVVRLLLREVGVNLTDVGWLRSV